MAQSLEAASFSIQLLWFFVTQLTQPDTGTSTFHEKGGPDMLKEFREFAVKGNVVDMAVGIIISAAGQSLEKGA